MVDATEKMKMLVPCMMTILGVFVHGSLSQEQRSVTKRYSPPIQIGDQITITGIGYTRSVGVIRLHSVEGSCDTRPRTRSRQDDEITCNPLVLKLRTRRHRVDFFKKGMEDNNYDVLISSARFPGLTAGMKYEITITVTYTGFDVRLNDDITRSFVTHGTVGKVMMIRATSGLFTAIRLDRGAKLPLNVPNCGLRGASVFVSKWIRITNGQDAKPGAYPWQAAIRRKQVYYWHPYHHICGATLISSCWVITAAHCVQNVKRYKQNFVIRVGDLHNGNNDTRYKLDEDEQDIDIEEVYEHEDFAVKGEAPVNDVALIRLKGKQGDCVRYSQYVNPVCLPEPDSDYFPTLTACHISGWGAKNWTDRPRQYPHVLQYGTVKLQDFSACQRMYGRENGILQIQKGMLCAGSKGVDTCQGDSGGPLVCQRDGPNTAEEYPFVLWGVTSWGHKCADTAKPGVYSDVTEFIPWIKNVRAGVLIQ